MMTGNLYHIQLHGQMTEDEANAGSPVQVSLVRMDEGCTILQTCTDQSGLIGLLRHLHSRGVRILSIQCEPGPALKESN
jgi:hypothetical protein